MLANFSSNKFSILYTNYLANYLLALDSFVRGEINKFFYSVPSSIGVKRWFSSRPVSSSKIFFRVINIPKTLDSLGHQIDQQSSC